MPFYNYKCPNGHVFDRMFSMSSYKRLSRCPECKEWSERTVQNVSAFHLKGKGFHGNDYKGFNMPPVPTKPGGGGVV